MELIGLHGSLYPKVVVACCFVRLIAYLVVRLSLTKHQAVTQNYIQDLLFISYAEQEQMSQLMGSLSTEREKNEIMQKQLESLSFLDKRKATKPKLLADQVPSVSAVTLGSDQVTAPVQQQISVPSPSKAPPAKVTKRVAPTSRRARVRGAVLQDNEDEDDN
uniref:Uncharacterized protein n=1 Tax=Aegilops tauschii subsp. strangulata TaxID=200361 RepID=A0A452YT40_AEGTS